MALTRAQRLARAILNGFESFFGDFQNVTLGAQARFERADWRAVQDAMRHRLSLYKERVKSIGAIAREISGDELNDGLLWREAKAFYAELVASHDNWEITQTFFNSVYCFVFEHHNIRDQHVFVYQDALPKPLVDIGAICREYTVSSDLKVFIRDALQDTRFNVPFENLERDVDRIAGVIARLLLPRIVERGPLKAQVLDSLFYRNKGAYMVGRIIDGDEKLPFVLPFLNNEKGAVFVDTVLYQPDQVSVVFSFTRSYFMVDASVPSQYVAFLASIMPQKNRFELYNAIGFGKHGKTEFYRSAVAHTLKSTDQYVIAPGIKGMVMLVFMLPSFDYVYKIIKDRFTPPKDMTREQVKQKYFMVKRWDRAGRMAETQEFANLAFDRRRFSDELMAELHREVPSLLEERGNALIIKHVYVERKMTPLNLYLRNATPEQLESVMDEYGNAIKQLAGANIFPGDMLLKNFGVTRHGRVVFYDYDEICPLTECNFRKIPAPRNEDEELSGQPWYPVGPNDVFPEEFRLFFSGNQAAKKVFDRKHADIYEVGFWQGLQTRIRAGEFQNVFPYRRRYRFPRP